MEKMSEGEGGEVVEISQYHICGPSFWASVAKATTAMRLCARF